MYYNFIPVGIGLFFLGLAIREIVLSFMELRHGKRAD